MMPHDPATWWTAFGAIAQALGSVATFAAVGVSLWIVISERTMRARGSAGIRVMFAGDGTPGQYMVGIEVLNTGVRPFHVGSVGWRTGWFSRGPKVTEYRFAIQNDSVMVSRKPGPTIVEPGRTEGFYTLIADMKNANGEVALDDMFGRKLPVLGEVPIWAMVNITGRKPLMIRVTGELAKFLRTREHTNTTGGRNMISVVAYLLIAMGAQSLPTQPDDAVEWCKAADADQHRLCQMKQAGSFLDIPAELRFVNFDLMSNRRVSVIYAFPLQMRKLLEDAIRRHLPGADERLDPWGHAEGTRVWKTADREYTLEADNGKLSVTVESIAAKK